MPLCNNGLRDHELTDSDRVLIVTCAIPKVCSAVVTVLSFFFTQKSCQPCLTDITYGDIQLDD